MTQLPIRLDGFDAQAARFVDPAGVPHTLLAADLVALAREGRDVRSGQRAPGQLRAHGALVDCVPDDDGWTCHFADGARITVAAEALAAALVSPPDVPRSAWQGGAPLAPHDHAAVMGDPTARLAFLRDVLGHGYARLRGVPSAEGTVAAFLDSFGPVRETNYGRLFDVRVRPDPGNLADSALALLPHTDNPYRQTPPDIQALHALVAAADGGATWLVDGLAVVAHLRAQAPEAFALLCEVPVRFAWRDATWQLDAAAPVIALAADGALHRLRINARSLDRPLEPDPVRRAGWWRAWDQLEACLSDPAFGVTFTLGAGEMVVMDNRRVLHGRSAFDGAAGERHLQGAYADIDGFRSQALRLATAQADSAIAGLAALFEAPAMDGHYGEAISIRDHMLQSAELAVARGLGPSLVAAALLHDIGWAQGEGAHEFSGAARLAAIFGEQVAQPVRQHVAAKRYLVARHPAYHARLSPASIATLAQQGGPMDEAECAAFEAQRDHRAWLALREIDEDGKDAAPPRSTFADYGALLRDLAMRHGLTSRCSAPSANS